MPASELREDSASKRGVRAGWVAAVFIVVSYCALAVVPDAWALVLRQFIYLAPLLVAAFAVASIVRIAPEGAELHAWELLGLSVVSVVCSESYFSLYQVFVSPTGPPPPSPYDLFNLVAALFVLAAMTTAAGLTRLPKSTRLLVGADLVSGTAILFAGVYLFWMRFLGDVPDAVSMGVRWATYSSIGLAVLAGIVWLAGGSRGWRQSRDRSVIGLVFGSLAVFAAFMTIWPLWQSGGIGAGASAWGLLEDAAVLVGYCLMMMAALTRLSTRDQGWRITMGGYIDPAQMWRSSLLSGIVLISTIAMGISAYRLPDGDPEREVLVAAASVAIIALVARTGLAGHEAGELRDTSAVDPVTGALNHRAFQDEFDERIMASRRRSAAFVLVVLDLDGFSRVNSMLGHVAGDGVLQDVVSALQSAAGRSAKVFRLSGDEFAVVGAGVEEHEAMRFATRLLGAVNSVEPSPGLGLSASIGLVSCDRCNETKEELLRRADAAQVWAKYHGKGRVVAYDERIVRALGIEERLRLDEEQSFFGMARALAAAADARDARNYYHARNVAALAVLLAEATGLDPQHVRHIEVAAILHDVGRIAMPDPVMPSFQSARHAPRADQEHSVLGAQLVGSLGIDDLPVWVRAHHERWDGTGFPDGLAGEEIPIEARIIALADAYDNLTGGRRRGFTVSKSAALQEIDHQMGTAFDAVLAERFIEIVGRTASLGWSDEWPAA